MSSLKDLRTRISSVEATRKITRAMQMVAASKSRRAQERAQAARPYAMHMQRVLANLVAGNETPNAPLLKGTGKDQTHLLLVVTSERGLCGGFNSAISRLARRDAARLKSEGKRVKIQCIGRKGYDILRRYFADDVLPLITYQGQKSVGFEEAHALSQQVLELFDAGDFDIATLYYSLYRSVLTQEPVARQLIPVQIAADEDATTSPPDLKGAIYDYEPDEETILSALLPRYVAVQLLRALLENAAGEQGARMTAMDNATRNAGEMIERLRITYNRSRQAQITKELIEIISGAEAL